MGTHKKKIPILVDLQVTAVFENSDDETDEAMKALMRERNKSVKVETVPSQETLRSLQRRIYMQRKLERRLRRAEARREAEIIAKENAVCKDATGQTWAHKDEHKIIVPKGDQISCCRFHRRMYIDRQLALRDAANAQKEKSEQDLLDSIDLPPSLDDQTLPTNARQLQLNADFEALSAAFSSMCLEQLAKKPTEVEFPPNSPKTRRRLQKMYERDQTSTGDGQARKKLSRRKKAEK